MGEELEEEFGEGLGERLDTELFRRLKITLYKQYIFANGKTILNRKTATNKTTCPFDSNAKIPDNSEYVVEITTSLDTVINGSETPSTNSMDARINSNLEESRKRFIFYS
ncbi:hypothetical protein IMCC1989_2348 [gamma proteobacterium IMCC1989]|nr:hypothetical protein IMCC1989_2348 [gamma proteobacterium IMCC1989]